MTPKQLASNANLRGMGPAALLAAVVLSVGLGACGGDPFVFPWTTRPDTVLLYSLARPELNLEAAYDFHNERRIRVEAPNATGTWDLALDTRDGGLVLLPPGALGITSKASVAVLPGLAFADVVDAPEDTAAYTRSEPVLVEMGTVYVVKTSQSPGIFGTACSYYAKLEPLVIDVEGGTLTFLVEASPVCNSRRLIPPA